MFSREDEEDRVLDNDSEADESHQAPFAYQADVIPAYEALSFHSAGLAEPAQADNGSYPGGVEGYAIYQDADAESYGFVPFDESLPYARVHAGTDGQGRWVEILSSGASPVPTIANKAEESLVSSKSGPVQNKLASVGNSTSLSTDANATLPGKAVKPGVFHPIAATVLAPIDQPRRLAFDANEGTSPFDELLDI
ncbi:MAG: hypothetical protein K0Q57_1108 [Gammaproteobacteria bacterium]|nr:hypothetical protein [Gammaproteobacteria bacterium]